MVEIICEGKTFKLFKSVSVSRCMDNISGQANLSITEEVQGQSYIRLGKLTTIKMDGFEVFTGCFEEFSNSESVGSHDIDYTGRDKIATFIDSSIPDNCKNILNVSTFKKLCELLISAKKIKMNVQDQTGGIMGRVTTASGETGMKCVEFLEKYAKPLQIILNTDGKGNLIMRKSFMKLKTLLLNLKNGKENNILDSSLSYKLSERFHKVIYRSNGNCNFNNENESYVINNKGQAEDEEFKKIMNVSDFGERVKEVISDTPMTSFQCKKAAEDEINIIRARSFEYRVTVAGFSANGELWDCGFLVDVKDDRKKIYGTFLIKDVDWRNDDSGDITTLILTFPDGYTGKDNLNVTNKKQAVLPEYVS